MGWQRKRLKDINERQRQRKDKRRRKNAKKWGWWRFGRACRSGLAKKKKKIKDERQTQGKVLLWKRQKNEVDGGLAGLVGVGWQRKRRK